MTASFGYLFNAATKNTELQNSQEELEMLGNDDVQGYYESRLARGDKYAALALDVVNNRGFKGKLANLWMLNVAKSLSPGGRQSLLNGGSYKDFVRRVNIGLANVHAITVDNDRYGIRGLLSADQISSYHENYFLTQGLPEITFGGSAFFGMRTDYWCNGCDTVP